MKGRVPLLLSLVFAVGCSDSSVTGPPPLWRVVPASTAAVTTPAAGITVMTRNLYIGADVDAVIVALLSTSSDDDLPALLVAVGTLQNTDFPTRVEALADEIAQARPHVVGLQEVEDLHIHLALPEGRIDIDQNFQTASRYEVLSIPTAILFEDGEPRETVIGARPRSQFEEAWAAWLTSPTR